MADFYLKDVYNRGFYNQLAENIKKHFPPFNTQKFLSLIFDGKHEQRELKERMHHAAKVLNDVLKGSYAKKIAILKPVAPTCEDGLTGLIFPDFVEMFGMDEENKAISVDALADFTKYSSSEFAIRPFIIKYEDEMMGQMLKWAHHENHHVRRLASEGCRPRLPWSIALPAFKKDPSKILPILEILKADASEYVRKSVANNLNDISKDHPELVLEIAKKWKGNNKNTNWIVKHACRTMLKAGNPEAMSLFGFGHPEAITISNLKVSKPKVKIGDGFEFSFDLQHSEKGTVKLRLEYGVYYMKSNGKQNRKVFNITENKYTPNEIHPFSKKQHFKNLTTRKHYTGAHQLSVIVNGVEKAFVEFELT